MWFYLIQQKFTKHYVEIIIWDIEKKRNGKIWSIRKYMYLLNTYNMLRTSKNLSWVKG